MYAQTGQYFSSGDRKKQYSKKKEKKGIESPGDTDGPCATAKLRNSFSIRSRPRREKRILCYIPSMKFTDRDPIDPSFVHFFYILSNSSPPLLFLVFFFRNRSKAVGKKEKIEYADTWRLKGNEKRRERTREAILLFYYLFYELHRRRGRFREFIFNPGCRLLSIRYSDNFCFEKPW